MVQVPEAFRAGVVAHEGAAGQAWLERLPGLVNDVLEAWGCTLDGAVRHGAVGIVVPVRRRLDGAGVVKVSFPHPGNIHEPDAYAWWNGRAAVSLRERDDASFAMLLERAHITTLADSSAGEGADPDECPRVAGLLVRRLALPAPPWLPALTDKVDAWLEQLHRDIAEFPDVLDARALGAAACAIEELGREQPALTVHGDLHAGNVLAADREPWLAIDPKGYRGDPAYDIGPLLKAHAWRHRTTTELPALVQRSVQVFAEAASLDSARVRRWARLHAVWAVLWGFRYGYHVTRTDIARDEGLDLAIALVDVLA